MWIPAQLPISSWKVGESCSNLIVAIIFVEEELTDLISGGINNNNNKKSNFRPSLNTNGQAGYNQCECFVGQSSLCPAKEVCSCIASHFGSQLR
jgi:hypothetical protein